MHTQPLMNTHSPVCCILSCITPNGCDFSSQRNLMRFSIEFRSFLFHSFVRIQLMNFLCKNEKSPTHCERFQVPWRGQIQSRIIFFIFKLPNNSPESNFMPFFLFQKSGCAFLTYFNPESAATAQSALHEKQTLPGVSPFPRCIPVAWFSALFFFNCLSVYNCVNRFDVHRNMKITLHSRLIYFAM